MCTKDKKISPVEPFWHQTVSILQASQKLSVFGETIL
jgi:hypothetical protein